MPAPQIPPLSIHSLDILLPSHSTSPLSAPSPPASASPTPRSAPPPPLSLPLTASRNDAPSALCFLDCTNQFYMSVLLAIRRLCLLRREINRTSTYEFLSQLEKPSRHLVHISQWARSGAQTAP